jgi:hypothetical protein
LQVNIKALAILEEKKIVSYSDLRPNAFYSKATGRTKFNIDESPLHAARAKRHYMCSHDEKKKVAWYRIKVVNKVVDLSKGGLVSGVSGQSYWDYFAYMPVSSTSHLVYY